MTVIWRKGKKEARQDGSKVEFLDTSMNPPAIIEHRDFGNIGAADHWFKVKKYTRVEVQKTTLETIS